MQPTTMASAIELIHDHVGSAALDLSACTCTLLQHVAILHALTNVAQDGLHESSAQKSALSVIWQVIWCKPHKSAAGAGVVLWPPTRDCRG